MMSEEKFEGTYCTPFSFPKGWDCKGWKHLSEIKVPGGRISILIDSTPVIKCLFSPRDQKPFEILSSPIKFILPTQDILIIAGWSQRNAKLWINKTLAASTDSDFIPLNEISISTKINEWTPDTTSFEKDRAERLSIRVKKINTLSLSQSDPNKRLLTIAEKIKRLEDSVSLLKDYIHLIKSGKENYYIPLAQEIRALICTGGKNMFPLLQNISGQMNQHLNVYTNTINTELPIPALFQFDYFLSIEPTPSCKTLVDLDHWLELKHTSIMNQNGSIQKESNNDVIRTIADSLGSHVDNSIKPLIDRFSSITISEGKNFINAYTQYLCQIAMVIINLSDDLINIYKKNSF